MRLLVLLALAHIEGALFGAFLLGRLHGDLSVIRYLWMAVAVTVLEVAALAMGVGR